MPTRALNVEDVAAELGRKVDWVHNNWRELVQIEGMPAPLHGVGALAWSAPAFYAWLDRDLAEPLKPAAAAYRAALEAARPEQQTVRDNTQEWRDHLNNRFNTVI